MKNIEERLKEEQQEDLAQADEVEALCLSVISACNRVINHTSDYFNAIDKQLFSMFTLEVHRMMSMKRQELEKHHKRRQMKWHTIVKHKS